MPNMEIVFVILFSYCVNVCMSGGGGGGGECGLIPRPLQSVNVCMSGESVVSFPGPYRVLMFACRGRVWSHSQTPAEC